MNLKTPARNVLSTARRLFLSSRRRKVAAGSAAAVIVVLAAGAIYTAWVYSAARTVERSVDRVEQLNIAAIAAGDETALNGAETLLAESDSATRRLSGRLGPARVGAAVFGWVPWFGDQLRAPCLLADRAEAGLVAAKPFVPAAKDLFDLQALVTGNDLLSEDASAEFNRLVASVETHAAESAERLEAVQEAAGKMDGLSLLGMFRSRADKAEAFEQKLLSYGGLLDSVPEALRSTWRVADAAQQLVAEIEGLEGDVQLGDLSQLTAALAEDARTASENVALLHTAVAEALPGSSFSSLSEDLVTATTAVDSLASGLSGIAETFEAALNELKQADDPLLEDGDALKNSLSLLVAEREGLAAALEDSQTGLESINELFESGRAGFLPHDLLDVLNDQSSFLLEAGALMRDGPEVILDLIAAEGTKTYLVLGQTSDELRAAGGFTSSAWTMTFTNGALESSVFIPIVEFDDPELLDQLPPVPEALSYHMDAGALYLRDVGWDPDFPTVGRLASTLFSISQGGEVDGVISVTQWGIIRLIEAVGGVEVDGEFIAPDEAISVIEERTDSEGTGYLQQLFDGLIEAMRGDLPEKTQFELVKAFREILEHKDLMIYSADPATQSKLASLDWAGEFPLEQTDRLGVVDSNVGWSKSDRSIARSANYHVNLSDPARPSAELTLSYRHTGLPVGRDCSEQRPPTVAESPYDIARNSCYWNYFRAYVAVGSQLTAAPDLPLPVNSVADRLDRQEPGSSTFSHEFDANGDYFAGLLATGPGQSEQFSIHYRLPASVAQVSEDGIVYELDLVAQPGARGRSVVVEIELPEGHTLKSASHTPERISGSVVTFEFDLLQDEVLRIETSGPGADTGQHGALSQ